MTSQIGWPDIVLRLGLAAAGSALIGFNREEHRLAAGLRTTLLVGLAAAISMIQVNLMLSLNGKASDSFVMLDLMRLPLGILSGMGFIGAGAILRKDNRVSGVTTAATLWFVTVMGLCFGGGQIGLGLCAGGLGYGTLTSLKRLEQHFQRDHRAMLSLTGTGATPGINEISRIGQTLNEAGYKVAMSSVTLNEKNAMLELKYEVRWYGRFEDPPPVLGQLASEFQIARIEWQVVA